MIQKSPKIFRKLEENLWTAKVNVNQILADLNSWGDVSTLNSNKKQERVDHCIELWPSKVKA